ncbi:MAG: hypothetical protein ORN98_03335 [Alphaproteobacteria bacterium]|nr:hypothetical protein [Alphaproteobacteria bacterium]
MMRMETITRSYDTQQQQIKKSALYDAMPGVYQEINPDELMRIHTALSEDYSLGDIMDYLELGEFIEGIEEPGLELDDGELPQLLAMAEEMRDYHPFGFIAMCRDIFAANPLPLAAPIKLFANF